MRSNSVHSNSHLLLPVVTNCVKLMSAIVISLLLTACGGGISGTGDGGVIQPTTSADNTGSTNNTDSGSDIAAESPADANISDADISDGAGPTTQNPTVENTFSPLTNLDSLVPDRLLQTSIRNEGLTATASFTDQLVQFVQEVTDTSNAISTAVAFQAAPISTEFDSTLSFSIDGTDTIVASSDTSDSRFLFSNNSERAIQLLTLQTDSLPTVIQVNQIRRVDHNSNSVFQATIAFVSDFTTIIRADLNINGVPSFLEFRSIPDFGVAFTQHPTDPTIPRQRELIGFDGEALAIQTCTGVIEDCSDDSDFSGTEGNFELEFLTSAFQIENALSQIENIPAFTLPDGVNEAVLATSGNIQPTEDQIQCGLQRVDNNIRFFCLRPLPLESDVSLLSETVSGGEIIYQLLQE